MKQSAVLLIFIAAFLSAGDGLSATPGLFRGYTTGVIRPDEGTVEVELSFSKPVEEFASADGQFIFAVKPARRPGKDGNTLLCLFMPPEPGRGLSALVRTGKGYYRVDMPSFSYVKNEMIHLAMSWGKALTLFVNGRAVGSTPMKEGIGPEFLSHGFQADMFPPFNVHAMKLSTRASGEGDVYPGRLHVADDDTSFIASNGMRDVSYRTTRWHTSCGYHALIPAWRFETQVYTEGETPFMEFIGVAHKAAEYRVSIQAYDSDGVSAFTTNTRISLMPDGVHRVFSIPLALKHDYYRIITSIHGADDAFYTNAISILPRTMGTDGALSKFYGQHRDTDVEASFFTKLGARSTRTWAGGRVFLWQHIEPEQGQFEWTQADAYVSECRNAKLDILGLLGNPPRWAALEPDEAHKKKHPLACRPERWKPKDTAAWGRYVFETAQRYKGVVASWEIYNEVNFAPPARPGSFSGSVEDYFEMLKTAYTEVKRADPKANVLISGFSPNGDRAWPLSLMKMGALNYCDIFNIHGYSGVDGVKDWLAAYKKEKPAMPWWQTEQMWFQIEDHEKRILPTVEYYAQFLAAGAERYYNMGTTEVFADRYIYSPTSGYHITGVFMEMLRTCNAYKGMYRFTGSDEFPVRHYFTRTDGTILSIFASAHASVTAGPCIAAYDSMGRTNTITDGETVPVSNAAYIISAKPLVIKNAVLHARKTVCQNGGFEEIDGDIGEGGLAAGKPRIWSYRDKNFDPSGAISISADANSGKYALAVSGSGKGRVFAVQYTRVPAGNYIFSAYFKRGEGSGQKPHLQYNIADVEKKAELKIKAFDAVSGEYRRYEWVITMPDVEALTLGVGMSEGTGTVLIDEVRFERTD
ncbi:MAG: endo-1,4-beta-xylanase [Spirochaetota bacterium]